MTAATASGMRVGRPVVHRLAWLGLGLAVGALLLLVAGPLGSRAGWWRYNFAFSTLMPGAAFAAAGALAVSALALLLALIRRAPRSLVLAASGLVIAGVAAYFLWQASEMRGKYPRMNDVTTDFEHPPSLAFSAPMRRAEGGGSAAYGGAETAALQQKFYPGIAPAMLDGPPAEAFTQALAVAKAKGWTILRADPAAGVIEAYDRSRWFGFTDDIAIRVTAAGEGSRVDIRSHARQGRGDLGVNAARVHSFLAALQQGS